MRGDIGKAANLLARSAALATSSALRSSLVLRFLAARRARASLTGAGTWRGSGKTVKGKVSGGERSRWGWSGDGGAVSSPEG